MVFFRPFRAALALCALSAWPAPARAAAPAIAANADNILIDGSPLFLKGVDYSPYILGDDPGTGPLHVDFKKDLLEIKNNLHANAVRIYNPLPAAFYQAVNETWKDGPGLWVIQGVYLPPDPPSFITALPDYQATVEAAVDWVYSAGGEQHLLAWVLGSGFSVGAVSRTIENHQTLPRFQGVHYRAPSGPNLPRPDSYPGCPEPALKQFSDPHPFQSFLARLADAVALREEAKGGKRHLIGHGGIPEFCPFLGTRDRVTPNPVDLSFLDLIFENAFSYANPYLTYQGFQTYLENLKLFYSTRPVILLETGYSTSPGGVIPPPGPLCGFPNTVPLPLTLQFGGATETDQALAIEKRYVDVISSGHRLAGFFVFEFYDEWWLGGNAQQQNPDQPIEWFGLKSVGGTPNAPVIREKFAYKKVASLYGCGEPDASTAGCGLVLRTPRVIEGTFGKEFSHVWQVDGGKAPYRWTLTGDPLPRGLAFDAAKATLSGTPEQMGHFCIRIRVEDSSSPPLGRERLDALTIGPPAFAVDRGKRQILMNGKPFFLKGIDYSPFIGGDAPWTEIRVAKPADDLRDIREKLHANTIRVYQPAPKQVYDAARENGVFIIQGIHLQVDCHCFCECTLDCPQGANPDCPAAGCDLLEPCYFASLKQHVIDEIDEVHKAGGDDVVLCFVVGNEINFCAQRRTIRNHQDWPRYQGRFYSVPVGPAALPPVGEPYPRCPFELPEFFDPHPFQSFVTELVDLATAREVDRYASRHLMAHATEPNMSIVPGMKDRYEPACHFPVDLGFLDIVFQNTYSYFPPYIRFVSGYRGYLEEAARAYPDAPYVVLECGYSTSPHYDPNVGGCATEPVCGQPETALPLSFCFGGNSEDEQALGIATQYLNSIAPPSPTAGFFVFEYYDEWWKGADPSEGPCVQDEHKVEEWFGLKAVNSNCDNLTIRNKKAFETVGRMFSLSDWCPGPEALEVTVGQAGVEVKLEGPEPYDGITIFRDGSPIAELPAGVNSYVDPAPPAGERRYGAVPRIAHVSCPMVEEVVFVLGDRFRRGDFDDNAAFDITDPILLLNALFLGGKASDCPDAADSNDDGELDLTDAIYSLARLFLGGEPIPTPGPENCGEDLTLDALGPCRASC